MTIRKIKTLGLAVVAVLAMSAVVASAASAANFTASSYNAIGEGGQTTKHVLTIQGQKAECTEINYHGVLTGPSEQLTIHPTYDGCTAFGFIGAKIHMNECDYLYTAGNGTVGSMHIKCPGTTMTITAGGCVVHIGAQTPGGSVDYKNEAPGILITSTTSGIKSNITSGFGCTLSSKTGDTTGVTTGSVQFNAQAGVTMDVG